VFTKFFHFLLLLVKSKNKLPLSASNGGDILLPIAIDYFIPLEGVKKCDRLREIIFGRTYARVCRNPAFLPGF
jgi:hypothetical protein